jgi:DNA-binding CsgD family transcriptional regulator
MRLSPGLHARVRAEVAYSPEVFGYVSPAWSGELLSDHLRSRHGVELCARQSRRLLRSFGVGPAPRTRKERSGGALNPLQSTGDASPFKRPAPEVSVGKTRRQELALRKIRRLASSGLPLYPFVLTLFDLIAEAIPAGDLARGMWTDPGSSSSWVFANLDQSKWVPVLAELTQGHNPTSWPCFRPRDQLDQTRKVLFTYQEFALPNYTRTALYNEFLRPLKLEEGLLLRLAIDDQLAGYYPVYRSSAMKPFDRDDHRFLIAAAPHIAQGLQNAKLIAAMSDPPQGFTPILTPGVVVMTREGQILGMDHQARSVFFQVGMHDGVRWSAFAEPQLGSLLAYVAKTLREIFDNRDPRASENGPPVARILSHRAGIVLKLTGHLAPGANDQGLFVVLVEQLEPEAFRRARLMYRHGLAPREAEMLVMLHRGTSVACIAEELGISTATAKTYVRNLVEKLDAPNLRTLRMGLRGGSQAQVKTSGEPRVVLTY